MRFRSLVPRPVRQLVWQAARQLFRGDAVSCPICGAGLRFFLPFGVGGRLRPHALCPGCQSLERDRFAWLQLGSDRLLPPLRVLHVAPERCLEPRLRAALGSSYVTADLTRSDVDVQLSIERLPFADASFDAVICNHVLEHVSDDRRALREIYRSLRPGGWALLQVPLDENLEHTLEDASVRSARERKRRFGQHDHVRSYGRDYPARLREAGFVSGGSRARDLYGPDEIARHGLDADETLHLCWRR